MEGEGDEKRLGERQRGRETGRGSSSTGVSPHQVGKTKARAGGSRLGQLPWSINEVGLAWLKSLSWLGKGLLRKEGGRLGG